jgi:DNA polymerase (family 10)
MQEIPLSRLPKLNLHIHTRFSDGTNSMDMIVNRALKLKFNYIAFTDHFSNSWKAGVIKTLDSYKKIDIYLKTIRDQKDRLSNQNTSLTILKGIEIDLGSSFDYITKLINPARFDLILLEYMNSLETLEFTEDLLNYWMEATDNTEKGFPILGLAHFDPSYFIHEDLSQIIDFLKKYEIYYEFNSAYSEYYSAKYRKLFDKIKELEILVGVGADVHHLDELTLLQHPLERIEYYGITSNYRKLIKELKNYE